jgi:dTDP-4-dehydrorhamnose reductase
MLGRALMAETAARGWTVHGRDCADGDITDPAAVAAAIAETQAAVVLNAAAWTDVDGAETKETAATRVNGDGPRVLAEACRAAGATLVHVSTDYVFAGDAATPYPVDAPMSPLNAYGRSKAAGERAIRETGGDWIIARTAWLYDDSARNFVTTIAGLARDRDRLDVVNDQRGRPTAAAELARQLCSLVDAGARGTFHCCNDGEATWFDLARGIVDGLGLPCRVEPCGSDRYPRPAPRPAYSVLDLSRTREAIGVIPRWEESLAPVLTALAAASSVS